MTIRRKEKKWSAGFGMRPRPDWGCDCSNLTNSCAIGEAAGKERKETQGVEKTNKTQIQQMQERIAWKTISFQHNWCQTNCESLVSVWDLLGNNVLLRRLSLLCILNLHFWDFADALNPTAAPHLRSPTVHAIRVRAATNDCLYHWLVCRSRSRLIFF